MNTITSWIAAAAIALALSIVWDQPTDIEAMTDVAADVQDAIDAAKVAAK